MTQEDKELLLKDLCARLPYKVKIYSKQAGGVQRKDFGIQLIPEYIYAIGTSIVKPYLRPMSSMTEEEIEVYKSMNDALDENYEVHIDNAFPAFDWLNEHHFDYRGLIEKGLALEAKEGMYKV